MTKRRPAKAVPRPGRILISATLVLYNEEALIERCLKSIHGIADEIIAVHDGPCADRTMEICRRYGARVFIYDRVGIAEPIRPFAFSKCRGEWILQIDADEFLSTQLRRSIRRLAQSGEADAYSFEWPIWDGRRYVFSGAKPCFFRRSRLHMLGLPQHAPYTSGTLRYVPLRLEHRPLNHIFTPRYVQKQPEWAKVHASWMWKSFKDVPKYHVVGEDWPLSSKIKRKLSFLYPLVGLYVLFLFYIVKRYFLKGSLGWRLSRYQASYNYFLYRELFRQRP